MSLISRREFLKSLAGTVGSVALAGAFRPSVLLAQSSGGTGKTFVCCNLLGGFDGLYAYPYYQGTAANLINGTYRPTIGINPSTVLQLDPQNGVNDKIGLHPAFSPLLQVARDRMKIIQGYGIPGDPGRSHDTCQIIMSMGATQIQGGEMVGFLARLMDSQNWDTFQYWSLATTNPSDINTRVRPPVVASDLSKIDYARTSFETDSDRELSVLLQQSLIEMQMPRDEIDSRYKGELQAMHRIVSKVRGDINLQSVGSYDSTPGIATNLRDAAKIIKAKANGQGLDPTKDTIILISQGGYDYHGQIINEDPTAGAVSMRMRMTELARNMAVFYQDLQNFGVLDKTVVALYSEFGRTIRENNTNPYTVGTDHGHGNTTIAFGGPIRTGVIGLAPTAAVLGSEYNALVPNIDYRDIFSSVFNWMGIPPQSIFPSPYVPRNIGLI